MPIQSPIFKYHFVWKSKYSYDVLRGDTALRFAGHNPRDLCRQSNGGDQGQHSSESHPYFGQCAGLSIAGKNNAVSQRQKLLSTAAGIIPHLRKKYWGRHLWSRGYFGAAVGAVSETQIKQYIEDQSDDPNTFKVWDEPEPTNQDFESDSPRIQMTFSLNERSR